MIRPLYLLLWIKKAPVHIRIMIEEVEIAKYILRVSLKFLRWTNLKNYRKWKSYLSNFSLSTGNEFIENFRNTQLIIVCFFLAQQCCLVWNSLYNPVWSFLYYKWFSCLRLLSTSVASVAHIACWVHLRNYRLTSFLPVSSQTTTQ